MQAWDSDTEELEGVLSGFDLLVPSELLFPLIAPSSESFVATTSNEDQQQQQQRLVEMEVERHGTSSDFASRNEPSAFLKWPTPLPSVACSSSAASSKYMRKWILEIQTVEHEKKKISGVKQEITTEDRHLRSSSTNDSQLTPSCTDAKAQTPSYNHKMAERLRRKTEAEHLNALRTYIPPSKKKDKVSTLKVCVHHIQELVAKVNSLKKEGAVATIPDCVHFIQDLVRRVDSLERKLSSSSADDEVSKSPDRLSMLTQEQEEESSSTRTSQEVGS